MATRVMSTIVQRPTAVFSPDGRWLAYTSNESGRSEVFVCSFPSRSVAGLDVGRMGSDVVPTPLRTGVPLTLTRFSSDGCFVHDRRRHLSSRPAPEVVGAAH